MKLLVTGGAGFIGSNFIRLALRERRDWEVINFDALTYSGNLENLAEVAERPEEIDVEAAKKLRAQALERLRGANEVEDVHRFTREYEAAQTRLEVAARSGLADMANLVP